MLGKLEVFEKTMGVGLGTYGKDPDFRLPKVNYSTLVCANLCIETDCDQLRNPSLALD